MAFEDAPIKKNVFIEGYNNKFDLDLRNSFEIIDSRWPYYGIAHE